MKKKLAEAGKVPENCPFLTSRDVNVELWNKLKKNNSREPRDVDTNMRAVQKLHNTEASLLLNASSVLYELIESGENNLDPRIMKVHDLLLQGMQMSGRVHLKIDSMRRANMRQYIETT